MACDSTPYVIGFVGWRLERDEEGYRTYTITHKVKSDIADGPYNVLLRSGLPQPGNAWFFDDDFDVYAFCTNVARVTPYVDTEPGKHWLVEQEFTTKPQGKCLESFGTGTGNVADDPLLEPDRVGGGFVKFTEEATYDRFGEPIENSAHEQIRGPQVEFDNNRATVWIEQNVADLEFDLLCQLMDCVNDVELWDFPARSVKLSNASWERRYTATCVAYYVRRLELEIYVKSDLTTGELVSGFDRDLRDEGTKVLNGHWDEGNQARWVLDDVGWFARITPDPSDPTHFIRYKDRNGENTRVILNGAGLPAYVATGTGTSTTDAGNIHVEKYESADLTQLGLPATIPP